jgi:hypothetical protein
VIADMNVISKNTVSRTGFEPVTSSVSGNVAGCSCFRIMTVSCGALSADVHGRMPLLRAVVTRLVTHIGTGPSCQIGVKARLTAWPTAPEAVGRLVPLAARLASSHDLWSASGPRAPDG